MLKSNSRRRKRLCNLANLPTFDRLNELDFKFMQSEEFQYLFRQRNALYAQIVDGLSEKKESQFIAFSDIDSEIAEQKEKFFYRHAFRDCCAMTRLARGNNRIRLAIHIMG